MVSIRASFATPFSFLPSINTARQRKKTRATHALALLSLTVLGGAASHYFFLTLPAPQSKHTRTLRIDLSG